MSTLLDYVEALTKVDDAISKDDRRSRTTATSRRSGVFVYEVKGGKIVLEHRRLTTSSSDHRIGLNDRRAPDRAPSAFFGGDSIERMHFS